MVQLSTTIEFPAPVALAPIRNVPLATVTSDSLTLVPAPEIAIPVPLLVVAWLMVSREMSIEDGAEIVNPFALAFVNLMIVAF